MLDLSAANATKLQEAASDRRPVRGATHRFYRYPARFSPQFARAFIEEFTRPGDLVVDPFVGGGTTLIEAMICGRRAVGNDINRLAVFISQVKTTPLTLDEVNSLRGWIPQILDCLYLNRRIEPDRKWNADGYFKNIKSSKTWRYQRLIQAAIGQTSRLPTGNSSDFARCAILRTAQLALDGKKVIPPVAEFRKNLKKNFLQMLEEVRALPSPNQVVVINRSASKIHEDKVFKNEGRPKLILTSPPYPGVHVLYHRWQIHGRRETPAPYWIANELDGDASRYYTLGDRHEHELKGYFENLEKSFLSIAQLADSHTLIVQMIAFSDPDWQLPKYLGVMNLCGLREVFPFPHGRFWRDVPNRKWHAQLQKKRSSSREVVLCHQKI